ncbi:hypothetical protein ABZS54_28330, partial [Embleya sp. NPDC005575]
MRTKSSFRTAIRTSLFVSALGSSLLLTAIPATAAPADSGIASSPLFQAANATANSTVGSPISRSEVISRAQYWLGKGIPYNQGGAYPDSSGRSYRTDCSGYVSMAWHLEWSPNTQALPSFSHEISRSELRAGDILNSYYDHVILFDKWDDAAHTKFSYYSFGSTPVKHVTGMSINAPTFDSHPNGDYKALRYNKIIEDAPPTTNLLSIGSDDIIYGAVADHDAGTWSGFDAVPDNVG